MRSTSFMVALLLGGCGPTAGVTALNAVINTTIAAGASAARRARGDCFTPCDFGMECDPESGLCEPVPCNGECEEGERCVVTGTRFRCEPAVMGELGLASDEGEGGLDEDQGE